MSVSRRSTPVIARPFGQRHQAIVSYRDNHLIIGAPDLRGTGGDRTRPSDLLLAALATDCTFVCQDAAQEASIELYSVTASAQWVAPEDGETPAHIHVKLSLAGPKPEEKDYLAKHVRSHCPTLRLLMQGLQVEIEV